MAGIKQPMQDIMTQLGTLQVVNQDAQTVPLFARVWNKQIRKMLEGKTYSWPMPAAFLEVKSPVTYEVIGQMYRNADVSFRVHLVHQQMDAQDGTMEQDLAIFDLRDQVIALMTGFIPTGCGPLNCVVEEQDDDHESVYEYIMDFVTNFTDSKGSPLDSSRTTYKPSTPPLTLEVLDEEVQAVDPISDPNTILPVNSNGATMAEQTFLINQ